MSAPGREPPKLHIVVPYEGKPSVYAECATAEDAARLKANLEARPLAEELDRLLYKQVPLIRSRP